MVESRKKKTSYRYMTSPRRYLSRMILFLTATGLTLMLLIYPSGRLEEFFMANPGLNGFILFVLILGMLYALRGVLRLRPAVRWINDARLHNRKALVLAPDFLGPLAAFFPGQTMPLTVEKETLHPVLESIEARLAEERDILRYTVGLLVFLGLLGTFWGLLLTMSSIGGLIGDLDLNARETGALFSNLITGLEAPLSGMGTAFSSSLFGLGGSLILGFLDLQLGQAHTRFQNEMEEWLMSSLIKRRESASSLKEALREILHEIRDEEGEWGGGS